MASASAAEGDGRSMEEETKEIIDDSSAKKKSKATGTIVGIDSVLGSVTSIKDLLKDIIDIRDSPDVVCPEDLDKLAREFVRSMGWPKFNVNDQLWKHYKKQIEAAIATHGFDGGVRHMYANFDANLAAANRRLIRILSENVDDDTAAQSMERTIDELHPLAYIVQLINKPSTERDLFLFTKVFWSRFSSLRVVELSGGRPRVRTLRQLATARGNVPLLQAIDGYKETAAAAKVRADILRVVKAKCGARATLATIENEKGSVQMEEYRSVCADTVKSLIKRSCEVPSHLLLCCEKEPEFEESLRRLLVEKVKSGKPLYANRVALDSMCSEVYAAVVKSAAKANNALYNAPDIEAAMKHELDGDENNDAFQKLRGDVKYASRDLSEVAPLRFFRECVPREEFKVSDCAAGGKFSAEDLYDIGGYAVKLLSVAHRMFPTFKRAIRALHATNEFVNKGDLCFGAVKGYGRVREKTLEDTSDDWPKALKLRDTIRAKIMFEAFKELLDAFDVFKETWTAGSSEPLQIGEYRIKLVSIKNGYSLVDARGRKKKHKEKMTRFDDVKLIVELGNNFKGVEQRVLAELQLLVKSTAMLQHKSHYYYEVTRVSKRWTEAFHGADNFKLSTLHRGDEIVAVLRSDFHEDDASEVFAVFGKALVSADIGAPKLEAIAVWAKDCWPKLDVKLFVTMVAMKSCHHEFAAVLKLVRQKVGRSKFQELVGAKHKDQCAIAQYLRHAAQFDKTVADMLWPTGGTRLLTFKDGFNVYHNAAYACALYGCGAERIAWLNKKKKAVRDLRSLRTGTPLPVELYIRAGGHLQAVVDALSFEGLDPKEVARIRREVAEELI